MALIINSLKKIRKQLDLELEKERRKAWMKIIVKNT
jgi:hypothetical protein